MAIEGSIAIDLHWDGRSIRRAVVVSGRPLGASRLLEGRSWQSAEATVPLLFSLCGRAQAVAAAGALEAARGVEPDPDVIVRRELMIAAECLREYAWRMLIDLPALLGEAPEENGFVELRRVLAPVAGGAAADSRWWHARVAAAALQDWQERSARLSSLLAEAIFGMATAAWPKLRSTADLVRWIAAGRTGTARLLGRLWRCALGRSPVPLLPRLSAAQAAAEFAPRLCDGAQFARVPTWRGAPAETGALARTFDQPLIAAALAEVGNTAALRLLARLSELALLDARLGALGRGEPVEPWSRCASPAPGTGLSATDTARGVLLHYARLEGDRVGAYRIVAPTEWNFHPDGAFVQGLTGFAAPDEASAEQAARLMAHALDPCVAYRVRLIRA